MTENYHWTQILRSNLSYSVHPRMLTNEGYEFRSIVAIKGENPGINQGYRRFIFDRSYVIKFIIAKIIKPLAFTNYSDFEILLNEAWYEYEKELQAD